MNSRVDNLYQSLQDRFAVLQKNALWRSRQLADVGDCQQRPVNFASNDYLGLSAHPQIKKAAQSAIEQLGVGSTASQLVCGYTSAHQMLEEKLCEVTGRDRAILFSSGYLANLSLVSALFARGDLVLGDRLNHASLNDAARLSTARYLRYTHANAAALEKRLSDTAGRFRHTLVLTESVFSMEGDIAPLPEITLSCNHHDALLAVDDAHGFGVLGHCGHGALEALSLDQQQAPLMMVTFGKALGCFGAAIIGKDLLLEQILQTARPLIYTTALPPALAVAGLRALELLQEEAWRREKLSANIQQFVQGARARKIPMMDSTTPIQPVILQAAGRAVACSRRLLQQGFLITAIRPPTVPKNTSRLRIVISASHSATQIEQLLDILHTILADTA